jgi:hypothetical protein
MGLTDEEFRIAQQARAEKEAKLAVENTEVPTENPEVPAE